MMSSSTTLESFLSQIKHFVINHLTPTIESGEISSMAGKNLLSSAAEYGLLGIEVPVRLGGSGFPFSSKVAAAKLLSFNDFGVSMSLINTHNVAEQIARLGSSNLIERHIKDLISGKKSACTALTEPEVGSDFSAIKTTAKRVQNGWILNGSKAWITNAVHAEVFVVYAQTESNSGANGIAAFIVESQKTGFTRLEPLKSPVPSIGAGAFTLSDYFCEDIEMLSPPGEAFKDILQAINGARIYVAAMCCSMLEACLLRSTAYGKKRYTFGKPLLAHQGWRWQLAEAAVELEAAQTMVHSAACLIDTEKEAQSIAAKTKIFATRMAQKHVPILMHSMGAEGLSLHQPFTRHLAASQMAGLVDGSTEMLLERIAKDFL